MKTTATTLTFLFATILSVSGFSPMANSARRVQTELYLKDSVAQMIDNELVRLASKEETEKAFLEKNKKVMENILPADFELEFTDNDVMIEQRKDKKMAYSNPERYCADRCVSTGNCDVYEDMYQLSPQEVMKFCTDCVLSEEDEPCDVPDAMFDGENYSLRP